MAAIVLVVALGAPALAQTTQPAGPDKSATSQTAKSSERGLAACRSEVESISAFVVGEFATPMTALLHGEPSEKGVVAIQRLVAESRTQLDKAAAHLAADDLVGDDDEVWELTDRVEMLRAFVEMFESLASADKTETSQNRILNACNGVALYLDDPNQAVVESAKFWQGVAYRRVHKPERSLQTLQPVLTSPENVHMGLLGRLERCRAMADLNQHAAALALAMKLEARLNAWFAQEDADARLRAGESLRAIKVELLTQWAEKLDRDGNATAAANARREAKIARGDAAWPPPPERLLALDKAIGGLAAWKTQSPPSKSESAH